MQIDKGQNNEAKVFYDNPVNDIVFDNKVHLFIFKKVERVVGALYLITELFPKEEPLKWTLRKESMSLVKDIMILLKKPSNQETIVLKDIMNKLLSLSSYISVANLTGLVSLMNLTVINQEIKNLISNIDQEISKRPNVKDEVRTDFFLSDVKDIKNTQKDIKRHSINYRVMSHLENPKKDIYNNDSKVEATALNDSNNSSKRRIDIMDIIREKGKVSIKDITDRIEGCSEKTIQRDLIQMIEEGLVLKEGERRWSKYSLKI